MRGKFRRVICVLLIFVMLTSMTGCGIKGISSISTLSSGLSSIGAYILNSENATQASLKGVGFYYTAQALVSPDSDLSVHLTGIGMSDEQEAAFTTLISNYDSAVIGTTGIVRRVELTVTTDNKGSEKDYYLGPSDGTDSPDSMSDIKLEEKKDDLEDEFDVRGIMLNDDGYGLPSLISTIAKGSSLDKDDKDYMLSAAGPATMYTGWDGDADSDFLYRKFEVGDPVGFNIFGDSREGSVGDLQVLSANADMGTVEEQVGSAIDQYKLDGQNIDPAYATWTSSFVSSGVRLMPPGVSMVCTSLVPRVSDGDLIDTLNSDFVPGRVGLVVDDKTHEPAVITSLYGPNPLVVNAMARGLTLGETGTFLLFNGKTYLMSYPVYTLGGFYSDDSGNVTVMLSPACMRYSLITHGVSYFKNGVWGSPFGLKGTDEVVDPNYVDFNLVGGIGDSLRQVGSCNMFVGMDDKEVSSFKDGWEALFTDYYVPVDREIDKAEHYNSFFDSFTYSGFASYSDAGKLALLGKDPNTTILPTWDEYSSGDAFTEYVENLSTNCDTGKVPRLVLCDYVEGTFLPGVATGGYSEHLCVTGRKIRLSDTIFGGATTVNGDQYALNVVPCATTVIGHYISIDGSVLESVYLGDICDVPALTGSSYLTLGSAPTVAGFGHNSLQVSTSSNGVSATATIVDLLDPSCATISSSDRYVDRLCVDSGCIPNLTTLTVPTVVQLSNVQGMADGFYGSVVSLADITQDTRITELSYLSSNFIRPVVGLPGTYTEDVSAEDRTCMSMYVLGVATGVSKSNFYAYASGVGAKDSLYWWDNYLHYWGFGYSVKIDTVVNYIKTNYSFYVTADTWRPGDYLDELEYWTTELKGGKAAERLVDVLHVVSLILGVLMMLYAALLLFAWFWDVVGSSDTNLYYKVSFPHKRAVEKKSGVKGQLEQTLAGAIWTSVKWFLVGFAIYSIGLVYVLIVLLKFVVIALRFFGLG